MSKAEERALEKYPEKIAKCVIFPEAKGVDFNTAKRKAFQEGYEQAEEDLTLTWEDMQRIWQIIDIANEECDEHHPSWMYGSKPFFSEVLRRFEEEKKNAKTK